MNYKYVPTALLKKRIENAGYVTNAYGGHLAIKATIEDAPNIVAGITGLISDWYGENAAIGYEMNRARIDDTIDGIIVWFPSHEA